MDVVVPKKRRLWKVAIGLTAAVAATALSAGLVGLGRTAPRVARNTLWIGEVARGELVREVSAPGALVSDEVRLVTARASGLVDRILVKPGAEVAADQSLIELSNPDLEFAALEAATAVKEARAEVLDLKASLGIQRIEQRSTLENTRAQYGEARRRSEANAPLAEQKIVATLDLEQMREHTSELEQRLRLQEEHAVALASASQARVAASRAKHEGLSAEAKLRAALVAGLDVRAGAAGLLAELTVELGQQVAAGTVLGRIIDPRKLKAELRVPEARAREVAVGQRVRLTVQTDVVTGRVTRIDPTVQQGNVKVEVSFEGDPPSGARLDLSVDGSIETERIDDALFMNKPAVAASGGVISLFRLLDDRRSAYRVRVRLGRSSVNSVEVLDGLRKGDRVILSDMSDWSGVDRIKIE